MAQTLSVSDAIDDELEECRAQPENKAPEGAILCEYNARIAWEKEIDKYYKLLMNILKPDEKRDLKIAQRDWVVYRDNEMLFAGTLYKNKKSKSWLVIHAVRLTNIFRNRALELEEYYEMATLDAD
ncbi:lysozyme inhibitor LprI family protein [Flavobacterium sp. NRK1]|uniref:lysozyme inhibitor LprI family protein n=1 Tax=Flavobacterium sp. NRK1 TaxID=2954929 RepID=UPI0020936772|nr:lysozyme inhibitor LprI family protein [Flavobacterium sp. NRK1]MCO6148282.1 DUF1311 domain-containing protein [Flavobacterium sp. NRK1]